MTGRTDSDPGVNDDSTAGGRSDAAAVRSRAVAYVVDAVVLGVPSLLLAGRFDRSRLSRLPLAVVVAAVVGLPYHVLSEGRYGRTVGKRALGIAVVRTDGTPCTYRAAAVPTALRPVDWLPAGYLVGLAAIGLTERRQRLGDLLADTLVVRTGEE